MTLTRKDATATVLTGLVVLTFIAAHQGWNVPLIGSSYRWAAVVVFALGAVTCGLGALRPRRRCRCCSWCSEPQRSALVVLALVTGSLTAALAAGCRHRRSLAGHDAIRPPRHAHVMPIGT